MASGNRAWVERLFKEQGGRLLAFMTRRTRNLPDASELAQEVWSRMLGVPNAEQIQNPEGYLFRVADNLLAEYARAQGRARNAVDVQDPTVQEQLAVQDSIDTQIDEAAHAEELHESLRQLPPRQHAAMVLKYWYELSYEEIAQKMGVSANTIKKFLKQGLAQCRARANESSKVSE